MVAVKRAYSKGQAFVRRISAVFAVFFGFISIFFMGTPKSWSPDKNSNQSLASGFFSPDVAHADVASTSCSSGSCENGGGSSSGK